MISNACIVIDKNTHSTDKIELNTIQYDKLYILYCVIQ